MTVGPLTEDEDGILLWVHSGSASVVAEESGYHLSAGMAIWVPAGVEHTTRTDPGSVVFPVRLPHDVHPAADGEPRVISIPAGWTEWLIYHWDDNSAARDAIAPAHELVRLIRRSQAPRRRMPSIRLPLRMPLSREAAEVAEDLLQAPGTPRTLESFAARERISAKTLQRQFRRETGLSFSTWRTQVRIAAAARFLDRGQRIGPTGKSVGFATPAGFTKAFRQHFGLAPSEYVQRAASAGRDAGDDGRFVREADSFEPHGDRRPTIPARTFWEKVNDHHELMWVYRGTATLRIGSRSWDLQKGEAIWAPAGFTHTVHMATASLLLTVGVAHGRVRADVDDLIVFRFTDDAEPVLLHSMVSEFTLFRLDVELDTLVASLFREQFFAASPRVDGPTGALTDIAVALRREPADSRSLAEWAASLRTTPRRLGKEILAQSGEPFPRWRARIRMDVARDLLRAGEPPGQVFRRVGYASPAAFSRAFTAAHGIAPRGYQRRERPTP